MKLKREYLDQARASSCVKPSGEGGFGDGGNGESEPKSNTVGRFGTKNPLRRFAGAADGEESDGADIAAG